MFLSRNLISLLLFATVSLSAEATSESLDLLTGLEIDFSATNIPKRCEIYAAALRQIYPADNQLLLSEYEIFDNVLVESRRKHNGTQNEKQILADIELCLAQAKESTPTPFPGPASNNPSHDRRSEHRSGKSIAQAEERHESSNFWSEHGLGNTGSNLNQQTATNPLGTSGASKAAAFGFEDTRGGAGDYSSKLAPPNASVSSATASFKRKALLEQAKQRTREELINQAKEDIEKLKKLESNLKEERRRILETESVVSKKHQTAHRYADQTKPRISRLVSGFQGEPKEQPEIDLNSIIASDARQVQNEQDKGTSGRGDSYHVFDKVKKIRVEDDAEVYEDTMEIASEWQDKIKADDKGAVYQNKKLASFNAGSFKDKTSMLNDDTIPAKKTKRSSFSKMLSNKATDTLSNLFKRSNRFKYDD